MVDVGRLVGTVLLVVGDRSGEVEVVVLLDPADVVVGTVDVSGGPGVSGGPVVEVTTVVVVVGEGPMVVDVLVDVDVVDVLVVDVLVVVLVELVGGLVLVVVVAGATTVNVVEASGTRAWLATTW